MPTDTLDQIGLPPDLSDDGDGGGDDGTDEEGGDGRPMPSLLRAMVDLRDRQIQKARIQFNNRLAALDAGADPSMGEQRDLTAHWLTTLKELEQQLDADIKRVVRQRPIFAELIQLKGVGPMLAAKLIALSENCRGLTDPTSQASVSQLWRFCGYAVVDGQREYLKAGTKATYNVRLKTAVYLISESFLKCRSPYRVIYDDAKGKYQAAHPDWTKMHVHRAAVRKMSKVFLQHLWRRWRALEGYPCRAPYVTAYLGHADQLPASEFGWPGD